ncbi:flavin reductase family protein [Streptomyces sp. NPDC005925]|uniref:flavin reductase family protein n=1 Tax=Streptomyces sp. NPDC005925 TaxID=3157172 RepID=UPI0033CADB00
MTREEAPDSASHVVVDPAGLPRDEVFDLLSAGVVPRPIAWTSTVGSDGVLNLAPFSFFTVVSAEPPMLSLTIEAAPDGEPKDTLRNIRATGQLVVNLVSDDLADRMSRTSPDYAADVDEFQVAGVTPAASVKVRPPRVAEAGISMECALHTVLTPGSDALVIAEVVAFHVARELFTPGSGHIDLGRLRPLGRIGSRFTRVTDVFPLPARPRPDLPEKVKKEEELPCRMIPSSTTHR